MRKTGIFILVAIILTGLYFVEFKRMKDYSGAEALSLDNIRPQSVNEKWDAFYKVRAQILDGQSARLSIPAEIKSWEGQEIDLTGAGVFFGNGCSKTAEGVAVHSFYLVPTPGIVEACEILPEIAMRWTILVTLENPWVIQRDDMIDAMVATRGLFRISTDKPYEAVFYLDKAEAKMQKEENRTVR